MRQYRRKKKDLYGIISYTNKQVSQTNGERRYINGFLTLVAEKPLYQYSCKYIYTVYI